MNLIKTFNYDLLPVDPRRPVGLMVSVPDRGDVGPPGWSPVVLQVLLYVTHCVCNHFRC